LDWRMPFIGDAVFFRRMLLSAARAERRALPLGACRGAKHKRGQAHPQQSARKWARYQAHARLPFTLLRLVFDTAAIQTKHAPFGRGQWQNAPR
jgi:hypothetical protein